MLIDRAIPFSFLISRSSNRRVCQLASTDFADSKSTDSVTCQDVTSQATCKRIYSSLHNGETQQIRRRRKEQHFNKSDVSNSNIISDVSTDKTMSPQRIHKPGTSTDSHYRSYYRRYHYASQETVWQPLSSLSLNQLIRQFEHSDLSGFSLSGSSQLRGVYADISILEYQLRLQALADIQSASDKELHLLLVLSPLSNSYIPIGTALTIAEKNLLSSESHLRWASQPACLYTQVFGEWEKKFTVQISLPNALPKALPALTFKR